MTLDEIGRFVRMAERRGLAEMHVTQGAATLSLKTRADAADAVAAPASVEPRLIKTPCVGRVRFAHPGAGEFLAAEGARVEAGTIVALLQVGPCLRPVTATQACVIGRRLAREGDLLGYGAPVFDYAAA